MRSLIIARLFFLALAPAGALHAQAPEFETISTRAIKCGERTVVEITGERLDQVSRLLFANKGISAESYEAIDDETAKVVIATDASCERGQQPFWLVGPKGLSNLAALTVSPFEILEENEPNNTSSLARLNQDRTPLGVTVRGIIDMADSDSYVVRMKEGERLSAEVEAMRLGAAFLDAHLEILGPNGEVIATMDDTAIAGQDPMLSIVAEQAGDYTVRVREAAFGGDYESHYLLHVGSFCRPTVAYPAGGAPGAKLTTTMIGDPKGPRTVKITLPKASDALFEHVPDDGEGGRGLTPIALRVSDLRNVLETEPNNDLGSATPSGSCPCALNGVLQKPGDVDAFLLEANKGEAFEVNAYGSRIGSPVDTMLKIYTPEGDLIVANDDGVVHDSTLRFRAPRTGKYVLTVTDHLGRGGETHVYRVEFQPIKPSLALAIPVLNPLKPHREQSISVPRGGRTAMLLSARRRAFQGPLTVDAQPLPKGVRMTVEPIPAEQHLALLMFEAEPDAPLGAEMLAISAAGDSQSKKTVSELRQKVGLVFGEPRQTVYHDVEIPRTPIVVTDPAPFGLTITQPRAPLASDGLLEMQVKAERRDGFDGPITLLAPMLPTWVERSEDPVEIASGESSSVFPLIATDRAAPGKHTMVLVGTALVDGATVTIASQRVEVQIEEPYAQIEIERVSTEQGAKALVRGSIAWNRSPPSGATAILRGLPKHASAPEISANAESISLEFPVDVGIETPVSIHNTLFVELRVPESGDTVTQFLGRGGVLEVLEPGGVARETASRLQVLRRQAGRRSSAKPTTEESSTTR